jgi:hypothetical protein
MKRIKRNHKKTNRKLRKSTRSCRKRCKTQKQKKKLVSIKNKTPKDIVKLSAEIAKSLPTGRGIRDLNVNKASSYSPTINDDLITLKSIPREKLSDCNNDLAFQLKEPLRISAPGKLFGKICLRYDEPDAKAFLLKNLSANKHIDASKVVPPIQIKSNCWFNTMFVTLFVSDKGRKFFHYFRQLMIEGMQADGSLIPPSLRNAFALLNFAIESSLTGSRYAYEMDTNNIIRQVYSAIPDEYHKRMPYVVKVDEASNPIKYYSSIINYLDERSLQMLFISDVKTTPNWNERIRKEMKNMRGVKPHIIVLEIFDGSNKMPGYSGEIRNKPENFTIDDVSYELDSCIVRDISQQHFCATLTVEGKEMGYDGMSFHRMVPMKWREKLNTAERWKFEGSLDADGSSLEWSFLQGYQMLMYYRV